MGAFDRLHPRVQRKIWDFQWPELRSIQEESILHLIDSPEAADLIIAAQTASGKTEAAFLPILSNIAQEDKPSVRVLYVSPLKALINDQFRRVTELCDHLDLKITKWHGEASITQKKALLRKPSGIVLITPESLESMLIGQGAHLKSTFAHLDYVVIDELHIFIGSERGAQLRSQLARLEKIIEHRPIRVGLSATIGAGPEAGQWLCENPNRSTVQIVDSHSHQAIRGKIRLYLGRRDEETNLISDSGRNIAILQKINSGKNLIFSNSKRPLEESCSTLATLCEEANRPSPYLIHHGSLSQELRLSAEARLRSGDDCTVFCTSTLELGIDVGAIKTVGLLQTPFSVASFIQRIGRSGRTEGQAIEFQFFLEGEVITDKSDWSEIFRLELLRSIALTSLLLEGWCEPVDGQGLHLSTLVHQLLAIVRERNGIAPDELYRQLNGSAFRGAIDKAEYIELLRYLKLGLIVDQELSGRIVLGPKGEPIVEDWKFYAVFQTPQEWSLLHAGRLIGTIPKSDGLAPGQQFVFAGRRWSILDVDSRQQALVIEPARAGGHVKFGGGGGRIHQRIHERMLEILLGNETPQFLDGAAAKALVEARRSYRDHLNDPHARLVPVFRGSRIQNTIAQILKSEEVRIDDFRVGFYYSGGRSEFIGIFKEAIRKYSTTVEIAAGIPREIRSSEKFDAYLPDGLLNRNYAISELDLEGAREFLNTLTISNSKAKA